MGKVNCMRFNTDDGYEKTVPKKEVLNLDSLSTISITAEEAKEKITYRDSEGSCVFIHEGKEVDGVILTMSSNGNITIGIKEVNV